MIAPSGSYRIAPYVQSANNLGMDILVVSNSEFSLVAEVAAGITVDFSDPRKAFESIIKALGSSPVKCVLATDDSCTSLCSKVARHFNLAQNSAASSKLTQRKDLGRVALKNYGCNHPYFQLIAINDGDTEAAAAALNLPFPVVLKPLGLSASRGVIRANDVAEFVDACKRIDAILENAGISGFSRLHLLVESYIDGLEFAIEGFVVAGKFNLLTIFDKPEPLTGPYFEETYYLTPTRLDESARSALIAEIAKCCRAYGLEQGPIHAEARIKQNGEVVLIELAARTIGGQCGQLIEFSLQQKLEDLVIQGMCGIPFHLPASAEAAGVLMIPVTQAGILKRVEGLTEAMQVEFIKDIEIHINPGYELIPLPEGSSYLGFIFAQASDFEQTYEALQKAYRKLRFVTQPRWPIEHLAS